MTELEPTIVDPATGGLLHSVLALLPLASAHPTKGEEELSDEDIISSDVAGFVLV